MPHGGDDKRTNGQDWLYPLPATGQIRIAMGILAVSICDRCPATSEPTCRRLYLDSCYHSRRFGLAFHTRRRRYAYSVCRELAGCPAQACGIAGQFSVTGSIIWRSLAPGSQLLSTRWTARRIHPCESRITGEVGSVMAWPSGHTRDKNLSVRRMKERPCCAEGEEARRAGARLRQVPLPIRCIQIL